MSEPLSKRHYEQEALKRMSKSKNKSRPQLPVVDSCEQICYNGPLVTALKRGMLAPETVFDLAATFDVLADPTRIKILHCLAQGELCVCDLAHVLGMSMSAVSHQLRRLRDLRLVKYRYAGRMAFYSLDDPFLKQMLRDAVEHAKGSGASSAMLANEPEPSPESSRNVRKRQYAR